MYILNQNRNKALNIANWIRKSVNNRDETNRLTTISRLRIFNDFSKQLINKLVHLNNLYQMHLSKGQNFLGDD